MQHVELSERIIQASFAVHNELGPGFLECIYERALAIVLREMGIRVDAQQPLIVWFRGQAIGEFVADLLVEGKIIVELKATRSMAPEFQAQTINYLAATQMDVGLIVNFGSSRVEVKRVYRSLPKVGGPEPPVVENVVSLSLSESKVKK